MSTRQYIGARYTPKFSGTYDATQAYEALEVVDNGSGTTYIAKKPVPPNIPLTNTEYWLVYGSSSGAILDLQTRVGTIENDIPVIQSSILSIGGQVENNTSDIEDLQDIVNKVSKRKFLFQGDSYTVESAYAWSTWQRLVINNLGLSSSDYMILENNSAGFVDVGDYGTFQTQLEAATIPDDITDIVVCGGANDRDDSYISIYNAVSSYIVKAKQLLPGVRVWVGMIGYSTGASIQNTLIKNVFPAYKDAAIRTGGYYIDNATYSLTFGSEMNDSLHPNGTGQKYIGDAITSALLYDAVPIVKRKTLSFTPKSDYEITGTIDMHVDQHGDQAHCRINWSQQVGFFQINLNSGNLGRSWQNLGSFDDSVMSCGKIQFTCPIHAYNGSDWVYELATLRLQDNTLYIAVDNALTGITYLQIPSLDVTSPIRIENI